MDARFDAATKTNQSGDRGWAFEPEPAEPFAARDQPQPMLWAVVAVLIVGLSFVAGIH